MSNPFDYLGTEREEREEHGKQDHEKKLNAERQIQDSLRKRDEAAESYMELVNSVLDQLRQKAYPKSAISNYGLKIPFDVKGGKIRAWNIWHSEPGKSGDDGWSNVADVGVILRFDANDKPIGFLCGLHSWDVRLASQRVETGLSRESLVQGLMKLHPRSRY